MMMILFLIGQQSNGPRILRIYQNGMLIREMPLEQDGEYQIAGLYVNLVEVRDGKAAIASSTCPGQDCVHSGWISQPGRSVVCLPNRVELRIEGGSTASEVDAVVR